MLNASDFPAGAVLVVGGSGGLGSGICLAFAKAGCSVGLTYHKSRVRADAVLAGIAAEGVQAEAWQTDVRRREQMERLVDDAVARFGRVHTMVFVAGALPAQKYISSYDDKDWADAIATETHGFYNSARAILPHLRQAGGGSITHLGSAGHLAWAPRDGLSIIPKAANEALVRGIALEEGRFQIRANSVLIGVIEAGMFLKLKEEGVFGEEYLRKTLERVALKRLGKPEEVAGPVLFLASNLAAYVTGQQIAAAGGYGL